MYTYCVCTQKSRLLFIRIFMYNVTNKPTTIASIFLLIKTMEFIFFKNIYTGLTFEINV